MIIDFMSIGLGAQEAFLLMLGYILHILDCLGQVYAGTVFG